MSGFLFSLRPLPPAVRDRAAASLTFVDGDRPAPFEDGPLAALSVRSDSDALWGPAWDPATGVRVWLGGRLALDEPEWAAAERLPYEGGVACRAVLDEFLHAPEAFPSRQGGAFALAVWDPRDESLHVATERMGYVPVYAWSAADRPALGSHPDVLAAAVGAADLDRTTMAETLAYGRGLAPHTYYRDVRELDPGTVTAWRGGGAPRTRTYWRPQYAADPGATADALGEELAGAITAAVRRRTLPRLGRPALMLSGGADSRAVLYAAHDPARVTSVTLYGEPNAELDLSRALAERAGSTHVALRRSFEHYGLGAADAVRITGGMWNVLDAHYTAFIPEIDAIGAETTLTGCYADYLFKGLTSDRRKRTLFGRNLPLYEFRPYGDRWYSPGRSVAEPWRAAVRERRAAHFAGLDRDDVSDAGRWAYELRRIRPVVREADASSRLLLQRALRWDPIFADRDLIDLYQRVPPSLKLNGQVWERAVARICHGAGDVIDNNTQVRIGVSDTRKMLGFLYGVAYRKAFRRDLDGTPLDGTVSRGSWPNFSHYVRRSDVLPRLWERAAPETSEILDDLLGVSVLDRPLPEWSERVGEHPTLRIVTLKLWLDQHYGASA
ncbi:asparagine synthase-related protein [Rubrivirga sp. S365]|uniref:asparagine synthase-related protein n=1 Tax=Rubrivirga sp. S365 TaxID=3076080 RepID=UPI0028C5638B|nr:asparagine synthase-related protein [Rubrivirga sp. S365]MDT7856822.1 asparagine synthase-related protein [Rubrivirga sp. S365]